MLNLKVKNSSKPTRQFALYCWLPAWIREWNWCLILEHKPTLQVAIQN